MKNYNNKKHIKIASKAITGGLATFLIVGLAGCEDKDPNCKDLAYAPQWRIDECKQEETRGGSRTTTGSNQTHSAGSSWLPLWLLMNNSNNSAGTNNAHSGYTYGSSDGSKNNGYFKSSSGSSGSSGG